MIDKERNVFVVHGRNHELKKEFFSFLRALGLNPLEWEQMVTLTATTSPTIKQVIEAGFQHSQAIIVLLSGDDFGMLNPGLCDANENPIERLLMPQPRQNVIFEAGFAFATMSSKTILLRFGETKEMSDTSGIHYLRLSDSAENRSRIRNRLLAAGCKVHESGEDWYSAGDFSKPLQPKSMDWPRLDPSQQIERVEVSSKAEPDYAREYFIHNSTMNVCLFDGRVWFRRRFGLLDERMKKQLPTRVALVNPGSKAAEYRAWVMNKNSADKHQDTKETLDLLSQLSSKYASPIQVFLIDSYLPYTLIFNETHATIVLYKISMNYGALPLLTTRNKSDIYEHLKTDFYDVIKTTVPTLSQYWL